MTITPAIKRDYIANLAKDGKRADGRKFEDFRNIEIETGIISKAEGSAKVKIGNTLVIAGIKMDVGEPYPDSPDSGVMSTAAELIPMASPDFEAGPPREDAIELARVVDRGIRESEIIEVDKLCIEPGEKVWIIFIDIHILDYDGNLFDAASLASLAALMTAKVPAKRFELGEDYPLPLKEPPISCTSVKFNGVTIMDPSLDEEEIAEARLTVATDEKGDLRAMQKGLNGSFSVDEVKKIIKVSIDTGKKIREQLYKSVGK
ncbi:MAG: exosome complex protein Rrp42 [Thermoplasmatales archaeon]|nr:MAG: exosome complex protein Rrp42 [Thermoplasmatales archaeon]